MKSQFPNRVLIITSYDSEFCSMNYILQLILQMLDIYNLNTIKKRFNININYELKSDASIKCSNSEHANDVKLVCFNESCKGDRLLCIQCISDGIHVSHTQDQQELSFLFEHIQKTEKECEELITNLNKQMDLAYKQFHIMIGGIRSKYQKSKQQFIDLNPKQMNSFFKESIQFKSIQQIIQIQIQQSLKDLQDLMEKLISNLTLYFNQQPQSTVLYQLYLNQIITNQLIQILIKKKNYIKKATNQTFRIQIQLYIWMMITMKSRLKFLIKYQWLIQNINYHYGEKLRVQVM